MAEYDMDNRWLYLEACLPGKVFVKTSCGKMLTLEVKPDDTISDVKSQIQVCMGIDSCI